MKRNWINIASIIIIIASLASWKFLYPKLYPRIYAKIYPQENQVASSTVKVEGKQKESEPQVSPDTQLTFNALYKEIPDAPLKKKDIGDTYTRSRSAIVIDVDTGTILHYQDGKKRMAIASLTKMMTAVIVMEQIPDLDKEIVTITKEMLAVEGTVIGCPRSGYCISNRMWVGEQISAKNLMKAMLMNSCNDAATALGIHIAGSTEAFAALMNKKAQELGLTDTNFCNPSGLDVDDKPGQCYSSAYDLARISAYSLRYNLIWEIMRLPDHDITTADGVYNHHIINTDVLLEQMPNCMGGKTGFTYEAGKSLMMAAHHPLDKKARVIGVLLDDEYRWEDMRNMFDWVFQAYEWPKK